MHLVTIGVRLCTLWTVALCVIDWPGGRQYEDNTVLMYTLSRGQLASSAIVNVIHCRPYCRFVNITPCDAARISVRAGRACELVFSDTFADIDGDTHHLRFND